MNIRAALLETNQFEQNEFFDKYIELIERNLTTKKEKFKTQCHHIIPKCYYTYNGLNIDNSKFNKVNLLYKDHLLAHYYLALCANNEYFKFANSNVLTYTNPVFSSNIGLKDELEQFLNQLDQIQELYQFTRQYLSNTLTSQQRSDITKQMWDNRSDYDKQQIGKKISNALSGKPRGPWTAKQREAHLNCKEFNKDLWKYNLSNSNKGKNSNRVYLYKDKNTIAVHEDEVQKYLDLGYSKGNFWLSNSVQVYNDIETKIIQAEDLDYYLSIGYIQGHNHKTSQKLKIEHYKHIYKGTIEMLVPENELEKYINDGWVKGRAPGVVKGHPCSNKGKKMVNDGTVQFMVDAELFEDYLNNGYNKGKIK